MGAGYCGPCVRPVNTTKIKSYRQLVLVIETVKVSAARLNMETIATDTGRLDNTNSSIASL